MKKIINTLNMVFIIALAVSACASPPTEEMQKAQDAVTRAESDADAVTYAGNSIIRARDALTRMQSEADSKRYDSAKEFANEAIKNAEKAISDGKSVKERSKTEAATLIESLQTLFAETSNSVNNAKSVPNILLDFGAIARDMDDARETLEDIRQSFQAGNNLDVIAKGQAVRALLSEINARINGAAIATSRKQ